MCKPGRQVVAALPTFRVKFPLDADTGSVLYFPPQMVKVRIGVGKQILELYLKETLACNPSVAG